MADTAPPGHQPRLEYGRGSAKLTIHWVPTSRRRHGSEMFLTLQKATLTISSAYSLTWKMENIQAGNPHDVPDR